MLYSVFLFIKVKRSTYTLELNKITRFKMVINFLMNLSFFNQTFSRSVQASPIFDITFSYERQVC